MTPFTSPSLSSKSGIAPQLSTTVQFVRVAGSKDQVNLTPLDNIEIASTCGSMECSQPSAQGCVIHKGERFNIARLRRVPYGALQERQVAGGGRSV